MRNFLKCCVSNSDRGSLPAHPRDGGIAPWSGKWLVRPLLPLPGVQVRHVRLYSIYRLMVVVLSTIQRFVLLVTCRPSCLLRTYRALAYLSSKAPTSFASSKCARNKFRSYKSDLTDRVTRLGACRWSLASLPAFEALSN